MITREQFLLQVQRLCSTFGDRNFPEQRSAMIWDSVKDLDYEPVIGIVDGFIRGSKSTPLPIEFSEAAKEIRKGMGAKQYALGEVQPQNIAKCWDCGDSGFIRLRRNQEHDEWAKWHIGSAPCHCYRGRDLIAAAKRMKKGPTDLGPQFSDNWKKSYTVLPTWPEECDFPDNAA